MTTKPRRKYSRFQLAEPDCKWSTTILDRILTVKVFGLNNSKPKIEYSWTKTSVPSEIKTTVNLWVKTHKFAGLSLEDFMSAVLKKP